MSVVRKIFLPAFLLTLLAAAAHPQIPGVASSTPAASQPAKEATPADPLGRETPRGAVMGFLHAAQDENYSLAAEYFQPPAARHHPKPDEEQDLAEQLLVVINNKILASSLDSLSKDPQGRLDDGLPAEQEVLAGVHETSGTFSIGLVRVIDDRGGKIWLFSRKSLESIPDTYDSLQFAGVERKLPALLTKNRILSMPLWQWLAILLALPLAVLIGWALSLIPRIALRYYRKKRGLDSLPPIRLTHIGPGTLLVSAFIHYIFVFIIGASIDFITGRQKRAPLWMQRATLEWLYRLLSNPRRLAPRYLWRGPQFFLHLPWSRVVLRPAVGSDQQ